MKKILFVTQNFEVGGVQTSLLNLLNELCTKNADEYDIKLFCFGRGRFLSQVPENVDIKFGNFFLTLAATPFMEVLRSKNLIKIFVRIILMIYVRIIGSEKFYRRLFEKHRYNEKFDAAISYFNDVPRNYFNQGTVLYVSDFVETDNHIAWIHTDPVKNGFDKVYCERMYRKYDRIICVSKAVKTNFERLLAEFSDKTEVVYNILNKEQISKKSKDFTPFDSSDYFNIVTVCRVDNASKRIDGIVDLCKRLKDEGITDFKWWIVGDGPDLDRNKKLAKQKHVIDVLVFVGEQENPYPYVKNADLFALYSAYEGYPMVIEEAKFLSTFVLTVNYAAAEEQITESNGEIASSDEDFYDRLKKMIICNKEDEE